MKNTYNRIGSFVSKKGQFILAILTIALFVLAAGAPNATLGIGR